MPWLQCKDALQRLLPLWAVQKKPGKKQQKSSESSKTCVFQRRTAKTSYCNGSCESLIPDGNHCAIPTRNLRRGEYQGIYL